MSLPNTTPLGFSMTPINPESLFGRTNSVNFLRGDVVKGGWVSGTSLRSDTCSKWLYVSRVFLR